MFLPLFKIRYSTPVPVLYILIVIVGYTKLKLIFFISVKWDSVREESSVSKITSNAKNDKRNVCPEENTDIDVVNISSDEDEDDETVDIVTDNFTGLKNSYT